MADPNIHLRQNVSPKLFQRAVLLGRVKMAQAIQMPESEWAKLLSEVEKDPRLRMKQVQQGQNTMVVQLTVDEAIKQLPQWQDFLSSQAKRYGQEFASIKEKLQRELR